MLHVLCLKHSHARYTLTAKISAQSAKKFLRISEIEITIHNETFFLFFLVLTLSLGLQSLRALLVLTHITLYMKGDKEIIVSSKFVYA